MLQPHASASISSSISSARSRAAGCCLPQTRAPAVAASQTAAGLMAAPVSSRALLGLNARRPGLYCSAVCGTWSSSGGSSRYRLQGPVPQLCPGPAVRRPAVQEETGGVYGGSAPVGPAPAAPAAVAAARRLLVVVACMPSGSSDSATHGTPAFAGGSSRRRSRKAKGGRTSKADSAAPAPSAAPGGGSGGGAGGGTSITSGPAPSAASSPVPAPNPGGGGGGAVAAAAGSSSSAATAVAVVSRSFDGSDSEYETAAGSSNSVGGNIVPFARRQPRALVLDCAYRPINVLTWYKAFHFDYFGKGEVLEYYPPPAVCTTGSGEHPLPAVLRVPQYTADMQDLCSRVACTRRNIMVRDGFCCQYCGSRRDLTLDHVHPVSKGGKETWENLVTACMRCNQKKSDHTLRDLGWKLRRQPKEPTPYEIGIVAGIATSDILRPPPEWEAYIAPYRERLEMYRRAAVEAGLVNLIDDG